MKPIKYPMRPIKMAYEGNGSDKIYNITPQQKDGGYVLDIERGPRLGSRVYETRPPSGTFTEEQAQKLYSELVKKRLEHRDTQYWEVPGDESEAAPVSAQPAPQPATDRKVGCLLLTPVEGQETYKDKWDYAEILQCADRLLRDDNYAAEESLTESAFG